MRNAGFLLTLAAFGWSAFLLSAAFWFPAYSTDSSGGVTGHSTLIGVNGLLVLIPVAAPLVVTAVVWWGLHAKCARGSVAGERTAITLTILLGAFAIVGSLSIGLFVLPVATALAAATVATPRGSA